MSVHHFFTTPPDPSMSTIQAAGNVASAGAVIVAWVGLMTDVIPIFLATLVSLAALVFYTIQIYESPTMRRYRHKRRDRKIAYLKARVAGMETRRQLELQANHMNLTSTPST